MDELNQFLFSLWISSFPVQKHAMRQDSATTHTNGEFLQITSFSISHFTPSLEDTESLQGSACTRGRPHPILIQEQTGLLLLLFNGLKDKTILPLFFSFPNANIVSCGFSSLKILNLKETQHKTIHTYSLT